jgi:hypothetical protein
MVEYMKYYPCESPNAKSVGEVAEGLCWKFSDGGKGAHDTGPICASFTNLASTAHVTCLQVTCLFGGAFSPTDA